MILVNWMEKITGSSPSNHEFGALLKMYLGPNWDSFMSMILEMPNIFVNVSVSNTNTPGTLAYHLQSFLPYLSWSQLTGLAEICNPLQPHIFFQLKGLSALSLIYFSIYIYHPFIYSLFIYLSINPFIYPLVYLSISFLLVYIHLFIHLSVYIHLFIHRAVSIHPFIYLSIYPPIYLSISIHPIIYLYFYLSIHLSIYPSIYLSFHLSIHPSIYPLSIHPSIIHLSIYQSVSIYLSISMHPSIYPSVNIQLSIYLFIHLLSIHSFIYQPIHLYIQPSIYQLSSIYLSIHLSIYQSVSIYLYLHMYIIHPFIYIFLYIY